MKRSLPLIVGLAAAAFLLFGAYMGCYYALLVGPNFWGIDAPPRYTVESRAVEVLLAPANRIDRLARPDYWRAPQYVY